MISRWMQPVTSKLLLYKGQSRYARNSPGTMKKIKAVIFDLDGTLANTLPLCIQAFRSSVEPLLKRTISDAEIIATFGPSEEGTIMALAPDHYAKGVESYLQFYESLHHMCALPFEGIPELLDWLTASSIRIAMVTGKGKYSTGISLKYFQLSKYFELIETGAPAGPRKAEGIQIVANHFRFDKKEMIYVGDAPSDIHASRHIGIPVVAAAWAETSEPEVLRNLNPDELFYTIAEFSKGLKDRVGG